MSVVCLATLDVGVELRHGSECQRVGDQTGREVRSNGRGRRTETHELGQDIGIFDARGQQLRALLLHRYTSFHERPHIAPISLQTTHIGSYPICALLLRSVSSRLVKTAEYFPL